MDSNTDLQHPLAANAPDGVEAVSSRSRKIEMWIRVFGQKRVNFTAVYDPGSRCSIMPKTFLEDIKCLDKMKSESATHSFNSRSHECIGVFTHRIRVVGKPCETYSATFCIVQDAEDSTSPIYIGRETEPPLSPSHLSASDSGEESGEPIRPILAGGDGQENPKAKEDKLRKRKKEDEDHKNKEDERNRKKRREGKKEGESQSAEDAGKQTK